MGLFAWSEEKIARETARLVAERDLAGLAGELDEHDQRRRGAAAAALGSFGADAVPAIIAATLPGGDDARRGAWAAFAAVGTPATAQVTARVMSMETLLSGDVPATLRYFERAVDAIGPGSQGDIAALVSGDGPWRERARACLQVRDSRDARVNREPVPGGHVLMPISLGEQTIDVEQAEEVLRATTREWAVTCFLNLTETGAALHDETIAALEAAVLDAVGEESALGADGLPEMAPVTILHRHLAGERGVLTRLQTDVQAARISPRRVRAGRAAAARGPARRNARPRRPAQLRSQRRRTRSIREERRGALRASFGLEPRRRSGGAHIDVSQPAGRLRAVLRDAPRRAGRRSGRRAVTRTTPRPRRLPARAPSSTSPSSST